MENFYVFHTDYNNMRKKYLLLLLLMFFVWPVFTESMHSPTWGFFIDLPEGYDYVDGDGRDRFSFSGPEGLMFDLIVYNNRYNTMLDLVEDINRRLSNRGDVDFFWYNGKQAVIMKLVFGEYNGWGFAVELDSTGRQRPMLLALSYGTESAKDLEIFHLSALDSIIPTAAERLYPGPIMEYSFPRGEQRSVTIVNGISAMIYQNDAEASQVLIEREFAILRAYLNTPYIKEATIRYYRFIYRDSYDRIIDAVDSITHNLRGYSIQNDEDKRIYAQRVLSLIQSFKYERDFSGSDFLNLVTAVSEGRGDCDNRAMLFAIILANVDIRSAMMLSYHYSHAIALADISGSGARFEAGGTNWLVAETTAFVDIGLIAQDQSDPQFWFAILFN